MQPNNRQPQLFQVIALQRGIKRWRDHGEKPCNGWTAMGMLALAERHTGAAYRANISDYDRAVRDLKDVEDRLRLSMPI